MTYFLPDAAKAIIRTFGEKYPELRKGSDDDRRTFTGMVASQIRFTCGERYGTKRADSGRPVSKDSIAFHPPEGGLIFWDIINGSTREVTVDGEGTDITGQVFWPVDPVDRLGPPAPPAVDQFAIDLTALYAKHGRPAPPPEVIAAHRGNPGGLAAIELMLQADDAPVILPPVATTPPAAPGAGDVLVYDGVISSPSGATLATCVLTLRPRPPTGA